MPARINSPLRKWMERIAAARLTRRRRQRRVFRPGLDVLEQRNLLSTFEVVNLSDQDEGSLRWAVEQANANAGPDTIEFSSGLSGVIPLGSQLVITDDVVIDGPGADRIEVSGQGGSRVFAVLPPGLAGTPYATPSPSQLADAPSVAISGLAITNGLALDALGFDPLDPATAVFAFGGGLYNLGGEVQLERVVMSNNVAAGVVTAGGAVANEFGGTLTVSRSEFLDNASAGFLVAGGGAITSDLGPTFDGETAATTGQPTVHIDRSSFIGNSAEAQAGHINDPNYAFSGTGGGGAMLNVTGALTVDRSYFENNSARGGTAPLPPSPPPAPAPPLPTSGGPAFGGAILSGDASPFGVAESTLVVRRSTFVSNTAEGGDGGPGLPGGLAAGGAISVTSGGEANLAQNEFRDNTAAGGDGDAGAPGGTGSGGGVAGSGLAALLLQRNHFEGNIADGGLGAAGRGGGLSLDSVNLAGFFPGVASAEVMQDRYLENQALGGIGGGIYNEGQLVLEQTRLESNLAVGQTDAFIDFVPGYIFEAAALGGGLSNLGTAAISRSSFVDNQSLGADGATTTLPFPTYPGLAVGGGLHNIDTATVTRSQFSGNQAVAGDNNTGTFAGVANGGGIYNDDALTLSQSSVYDNLAQGGDGNTSDINPGGGYGGGISSGTVTILPPVSSGDPASLVIEQSTIRNNEAAGGDGNSTLTPVPPAHAAGGGSGGGVLVYGGTADISRSSILGNRAQGGENGLGAGGGVFFFGFIGGVEATLSQTFISQNVAQGGNGGNGLGGGVAAGSLGSLFGGPVLVQASHTTVAFNEAQGGDGGDGLGGGVWNGASATLQLDHSLIIRNRAAGGAGGQGIGGGLYNLGAVDLFFARILGNEASTSDDDCFGC